ncbi:hypothetical protein RFM99_19815 [Mesorhizobium sp. VK4C]|uniref:hypothetical protein n=1 Tax=Mesorhizobium captivum TaxID=3072319 RepID=UPI002A2432E3|nr:hypothetical protein [Mesorhizobium sp. VK4C]MDX8500655.1 hypothetical protein [Mesorhizobium sp. VK4C]
MRIAVIAAILIVASSFTSTRAESLSTCDAVKEKSGIKEYLKCVARQHFDNYIPGGGPGPGMTMDEIDTQVDKIIDYCHGEGSVCEGEDAGTKIGKCVC